MPDIGNVKSTSGCPELPRQFYPCALEKAKRATPPRMPDGRPSFEGYWGRNTGIGAVMFTNPSNSPIVDPPGVLPYQPWAAEKQKELQRDYLDPSARCMPQGVPRHFMAPEAYRIVQSPTHIVFLAEQGHIYRIVPLTPRPHVGPKMRLWMGDSVGRWDGDTLVIETTNFNGLAVFNTVMDFATEALRVVERYTMLDKDNLLFEVTIEDPNVFTRPWKMAFGKTRDPRSATGMEMLEEACYEGNWRWLDGEIRNGRKVLSVPVRKP
jgi:hypothetical protein